MNIIVPKPIYSIALEPSETCKYRYKALVYPVVIESPIANPWGMCWELEVKIIYGKNKERTKKYPSSLRIRLIKPVKVPSHSLEWLEDTGKFSYYQQSCERFFVFTGNIMGNTLGWLTIVIRKLEN